jgi:hypothetical protein
VKKGRGRGHSDGFYMPEKKIIKLIGIVFSRPRGMHAAFARPFFSLSFFIFLFLPQQSNKINKSNTPPPEHPVRQVPIPLLFVITYRAYIPPRTKERIYSGGRRVILIFVLFICFLLEITYTYNTSCPPSTTCPWASHKHWRLSRFSHASL